METDRTWSSLSRIAAIRRSAWRQSRGPSARLRLAAGSGARRPAGCCRESSQAVGSGASTWVPRRPTPEPPVRIRENRRGTGRSGSGSSLRGSLADYRPLDPPSACTDNLKKPFRRPSKSSRRLTPRCPRQVLAMESREHGDLLSPKMRKRFDIVCRGLAETGANGETQACPGHAVSCGIVLNLNAPASIDAQFQGFIPEIRITAHALRSG